MIQMVDTILLIDPMVLCIVKTDSIDSQIRFGIWHHMYDVINVMLNLAGIYNNGIYGGLS